MRYEFFPLGYGPKPKGSEKSAGNVRFSVSLDFPGGSHQISTNTWRLMDAHRLSPTARIIELYRLAALAYTADTRISRRHAFNSWERDFLLHLPVADLSPWLAASDIVNDLLSFLTGDRWRVEYFLSTRSRPLRDEKLWKKGAKPKSTTVSLFSGGLDSLIGASNLLAGGAIPILIGHCDSPSTASVQKTLAMALRTKYSADEAQLQFWIKPPYLIKQEIENTTRSRSFLFFALGMLAAGGLGEPARLVVPENGFIALNAPLHPTRLGALSTRTVHPYTVTRFRQLSAALEVPVDIDTPYVFVTKGEMIGQARDQEFIQTRGQESMSCAHPTAGRWQGLEPFKHCGRCVPCIIRRASFHRVGWDNAGAYQTDVLRVKRDASNLEDLRAFLSAIDGRASIPPEVAVLRSGPIPAEAGSVAEFASIYSRGMDEVAAFLGQNSNRV